MAAWLMALFASSKYLSSLSAEGGQIYAEKNVARINTDPYCVAEKEWTREPEAILAWSDMMLFMVSTLSPCTK